MLSLYEHLALMDTVVQVRHYDGWKQGYAKVVDDFIRDGGTLTIKRSIVLPIALDCITVDISIDQEKFKASA